jgi:hypothetical protein
MRISAPTSELGRKHYVGGRCYRHHRKLHHDPCSGIPDASGANVSHYSSPNYNANAQGHRSREQSDKDMFGLAARCVGIQCLR